MQSDIESLYQTEFGRSMPELNKPHIEPEASASSRLVFLTDPHGLAVEQYKLLRGQMRRRHPQGGMFLVTSPCAGDGKTLTSIHLAWSLADGGHQTCLVDLDFRAPSLARSLGLPPASGGVAELLTGKYFTSEVMQQIGDQPLFVLPIRSAIPSSARQFASSKFKPLLAELRQRFEWVILDMAPAIPISDVAEVLPLVDGALLVVRNGRTHKSLIAPSIAMLGAKLCGAVFNDSVLHGGAYYGSYGYVSKPKGAR